MNKKNQWTIDNQKDKRKNIAKINFSSFLNSETNHQDIHTENKERIKNTKQLQIKSTAVSRAVRMLPFFKLNTKYPKTQLKQLKNKFLVNSCEIDKDKDKDKDKEAVSQYPHHYRSISNIEHNSISTHIDFNENNRSLPKNVISFNPKGFKLLSIQDFLTDKDNASNIFKPTKIHNCFTKGHNSNNIATSISNSKQKEPIEAETTQEPLPIIISQNLRQNSTDNYNRNEKKPTLMRIPLMTKSSKLDTRLFSHLQRDTNKKPKTKDKQIKIFDRHENFFTKLRVVNNNPILQINLRISYNSILDDIDIMNSIFNSNSISTLQLCNKELQQITNNT